MQIAEADVEPEENTLYSVASKTTNVRVQKAVDPEVAALLDDSDVSRFGSDVEDLEEDFVVRANLHEDEDVEEKVGACDSMNRSENSVQVLEVSAHSTVSDDCGPLDGVANGVTGVHADGEKPRPRRLLDEQFDLVSSAIHNLFYLHYV